MVNEGRSAHYTLLATSSRRVSKLVRETIQIRNTDISDSTTVCATLHLKFEEYNCMNWTREIRMKLLENQN